MSKTVRFRKLRLLRGHRSAATRSVLEMVAMNIVNDIIASRIYGVVRCGLSALASPSVNELAREFGLCDDSSVYKELNEADARRLARSILHRDMAYNMQVMPESLAVELADSFISQFGPGTHYFSNGSWHLRPAALSDRVVRGASWDPATGATFDTGVLAIGPVSSDCLWIEDED